MNENSTDSKVTYCNNYFSPAKPDKHHQSILLSGAVTKVGTVRFCSIVSHKVDLKRVIDYGKCLLYFHILLVNHMTLNCKFKRGVCKTLVPPFLSI